MRPSGAWTHLAILTLTIAGTTGLMHPPETGPDSVRMLREELARVLDENRELRQELAQARLDTSNLERELASLQAFVADRDTFGGSYEEFREVRATAQQDARRRQSMDQREERERIRLERRQHHEAALEARRAEESEAERQRFYEDRGFAPLGLDVYGNDMSFNYRTVESSFGRIDRSPWGNFWRFDGFGSSRAVREVDFTNMTVSGSVLNAAPQIRNIGVAITFFDENGGQVGHEIVHLENARPDVPYPFTTTIEMALSRPFSSSSVYVLYADPIAN